ncbi:hypothetical protein GOP47_0012631 [Adiantum capillus-veneris]|uniref:DNA polymerase eta n=1 Tax=Adiantum capillus-veneris TaxID=13818 RepID=A0A9D4UR21_ADICA|nr:hypothetical protein GOP47_0012631 [Adiantum capillus-veneris]
MHPLHLHLLYGDIGTVTFLVEQRKRPELRGKPTGVVQYNPWKGGGLIAVGYEARKFGVTRNMRGDEAKKVCPDIELIQVPVAHGKADLTQYRDAGSEVVTVLSRKGTCERASIDEVYLDITEASAALLFQEPFSEEVLKSHILGLSEVGQEWSITVKGWLSRSILDPKDRMLANGAIIIAELRKAVLTETGFTCSAGIAHNKMLAKLASGMHKPAQQTVVPSLSVTALLAALPVKKMKQLGGKLGDSLKNDLHISFVGDLLQLSETRLQDLYGVNTGTWLWSTARGLSGDEVKSRTLPKSHSCGKTFPGPKALKNLDDVKHWIRELAMELQERLDVDLQQNHRMAHLLTLHAGTNHGYKANEDHKFPSKSCVLRFGKEKVASDAFRLFERGLNDYLAQNKVSPKNRGSGAWAVTSLFIGASNIWAIPSGVNPITHFFSSPTSPACISQEKGGPSSPLSSSSILDLDAPLSPCEGPENDNETNYYSCNNPDAWGVNMDLEPFMLAECKSSRLPIDGPEKGGDESHGHDQPATESVIPTTDAQESDVMCTPAFGELRHVYQDPCALQLPASSSGQCEVNTFNIKTNTDTDQKSSEGQELIMDCSPVEQEDPLTVVEALEQEASLAIAAASEATCTTSYNNIQTADGPLVTRYKEVDTNGSEFQTFQEDPVAESRQQISRNLKLKDVWDRKLSTPSPSARPTQSQYHHNWEYKEGDIDREVFSELPEEIQEELCRSLGFKRSRKSTIGDFFKNASLARGNNANA